MNKKSKIINKFENRQIKFRVWNIKKKKYTYPEDNVYSIFWNPYMNKNEVINGCEMHYDESTHIIQQFTGLLDKNGKEIYEGDIVRQFPGFGCEWEERIGFIEYEPASFWIKMKNLTCVLDNHNCFLEIIGNIFENF